MVSKKDKAELNKLDKTQSSFRSEISKVKSNQRMLDALMECDAEF